MENNKEILMKANQAIMNGDNEGFLAFCTEDTEWNFIGGITLKGKEAVRKWMKINYLEPPKFNVLNLIESGMYVVALGRIESKGENGKTLNSSYADVWKFHHGKMAELKAFVIEDDNNE